jgi:hypothetical protein
MTRRVIEKMHMFIVLLEVLILILLGLWKWWLF